GRVRAPAGRSGIGRRGARATASRSPSAPSDRSSPRVTVPATEKETTSPAATSMPLSVQRSVAETAAVARRALGGGDRDHPAWSSAGRARAPVTDPDDPVIAGAGRGPAPG